MEDNAAALGLTYKQVRGWFIERRRRDKRENGSIVPSCSASSKKNPILTTRVGSGTIAARKVLKGDPLLHKAKASLSLISNRPSTVETRIPKRKRKPILLQHLLTSDYILKKVFRKEGPPLGVEFDSLPSRAFCCHTGILQI